MFQIFGTKGRTIADGLFAIARALGGVSAAIDNVSASIDDLAKETRNEGTGEALQSLADNLKDGLDSVAGQIGGA